MENGKWAGCVADVLYERADLSTGGNFADDRLHYVDFTAHIRYDYDKFFTHKPKPLFFWADAFIAFDYYGWLLIGISLLMETLFIYTSENILRTVPNLSAWDVFYKLYADLVDGGVKFEPKTFAGKLAFSSWLYYGLIVGSAYIGNLKSLIVLPGDSIVPENMNELAKASLEWGCGVPIGMRLGLGENIWKSSENEDMKKLHGESQEDVDAIECLRRAALSNYACFSWQIMAEFYMGTVFIDKAGNHPFLFSKDSIVFSGPTWIVRKREIWVDTINNFFIRQFSMGIVTHASEQDMRNVRIKMVQEAKQGKRKNLETFAKFEDGPKPFTLHNVKACFLVLAVGLVISIVVATEEIICTVGIDFRKRKLESRVFVFN